MWKAGGRALPSTRAYWPWGGSSALCQRASPLTSTSEIPSSRACCSLRSQVSSWQSRIACNTWHAPFCRPLLCHELPSMRHAASVCCTPTRIEFFKSTRLIARLWNSFENTWSKPLQIAQLSFMPCNGNSPPRYCPCKGSIRSCRVVI